MLKQILDWFYVNIDYAAPGFAGAFLSLGAVKAKKRGKKFIEALFILLSGASCANYLTPLVIVVSNMTFKIDISSTSPAVSFLLGIIGYKLATVIVSKLLPKLLEGRKNN